MLQPKRTKFRKAFKGRMKGIATRGNKLTMGEYGLQALNRGIIKANQLESARKVIVRETKRRGKLWVKIFPAKPYTRKPAEVKMGKGKGDVECYVVVIKPGRVIFELGGISREVALKALKEAGHKLPMRTRVITKE